MATGYYSRVRCVTNLAQLNHGSAQAVADTAAMTPYTFAVLQNSRSLSPSDRSTLLTYGYKYVHLR